jgi:hypothetical protein
VTALGILVQSFIVVFGRLLLLVAVCHFVYIYFSWNRWSTWSTSHSCDDAWAGWIWNRWSLTLISLTEVRNYLAFFDGVILKNLFTVKNLSFELFLP